MADVKLKSYEFRREREDSWRELEQLLQRAESRGLKALTPVELFRLPNLYRATVSSLSVARSISLDRNLLLYLESLAARGYFFVYGARGSFAVGIARFFTRQFPQAVRSAAWHILAAAFVMAAGSWSRCISSPASCSPIIRRSACWPSRWASRLAWRWWC